MRRSGARRIAAQHQNGFGPVNRRGPYGQCGEHRSCEAFVLELGHMRDHITPRPVKPGVGGRPDPGIRCAPHELKPGQVADRIPRKSFRGGWQNAGVHLQRNHPRQHFDVDGGCATHHHRGGGRSHLIEGGWLPTAADPCIGPGTPEELHRLTISGIIDTGFINPIAIRIEPGLLSRDLEGREETPRGGESLLDRAAHIKRTEELIRERSQRWRWEKHRQGIIAGAGHIQPFLPRRRRALLHEPS
ncbi:MAG: hypothetical protein GHCLOJNM_01037 [bacterium]|nr:hypothetical protein [bacterium]